MIRKRVSSFSPQKEAAELLKIVHQLEDCEASCKVFYDNARKVIEKFYSQSTWKQNGRKLSFLAMSWVEFKAVMEVDWKYYFRAKEQKWDLGPEKWWPSLAKAQVMLDKIMSAPSAPRRSSKRLILVDEE